jgi:hypothetical protein
LIVIVFPLSHPRSRLEDLTTDFNLTVAASLTGVPVHSKQDTSIEASRTPSLLGLEVSILCESQSSQSQSQIPMLSVLLRQLLNASP